MREIRVEQALNDKPEKLEGWEFEADERIRSLEKETKNLSKRTNKDEKLLKMQKKMFDKHAQKLNQKIVDLERMIKEKDKELRF